jgi:hypothetical protein
MLQQVFETIANSPSLHKTQSTKETVSWQNSLKGRNLPRAQKIAATNRITTRSVFTR